jgi:hypothetical protein
MSNFALQLASQLLQGEGVGLKGALVTVVWGVMAVTALSVYFTNRPYDKFPMYGKDDSTKTILAGQATLAFFGEEDHD